MATAHLAQQASVQRRQIDWEERLRNELLCVECDAKP